MFPAAENGFSFLYMVFGLIACFWGYRLFKGVLGIAGFILGAYFGWTLTVSFMGGTGVIPLIAGFAGGLIGGSLFVSLYFAGVFVIGAVAGWLLGVVITSASGNPMHVLLFSILALAGGILAVLFQRTIIIFATAVTGAWYLTAGSFYLMGSGYTPMVMFRKPGNVILFSGGSGMVILICWAALSFAGIVFQYRFNKRCKKEKE